MAAWSAARSLARSRMLCGVAMAPALTATPMRRLPQGLELVIQLPPLLEETFDALGQLVRAHAQDSGCALDEALVFAKVLEGGLTGQGFDAAHVGGDRSLGDDLHRADHPQGADVGAAAQLDRTAAGLDDAHHVAVLVAEEGDGARLLSLVLRRLVG